MDVSSSYGLALQSIPVPVGLEVKWRLPHEWSPLLAVAVFWVVLVSS